MLAAACKVRWLWKDRGLDLKGSDFEIGFWVGGGNTPNNRNVRGVSEIPVLDDDWDEVTARLALFPSPKGPKIGAEPQFSLNRVSAKERFASR